MDHQVTISAVKTLAQAIQDERDLADRVKEGRLKGELLLLTTIVGIVLPLIPRVGFRPKTSEETTQRGTEKSRTRSKRHKLHVLPLTAWGPAKDCPYDTRGEFLGADYGIAEDGRVMELRYSGSWTHWQGETEGWTTEVKFHSLDECVNNEELDSVEDCVYTLLSYLQKQAASSPAPREKAKADRVEQLLTCLGAPEIPFPKEPPIGALGMLDDEDLGDGEESLRDDELEALDAGDPYDIENDRP